MKNKHEVTIHSSAADGKQYNTVDEIYLLRELKQRALVKNAEGEEKRQQSIEMPEFVDGQAKNEYDEQLTTLEALLFI